MDNRFVSAIILAAGSGSRMSCDITKQRISVLGKSVLKRSVESFQACEIISEIIVVTRADEIDFAKSELFGLDKVSCIVCGGRTRAESASCGLACVSERAEFIAIHDAARCLVSCDDISKTVKDAFIYGAATASYKATDTIKQVDQDGCVLNTLDRSNLVHVLTPQVFLREVYERAVKNADLQDPAITDDNMLVERIGIKPHCTQTSRENVKITYQEDIAYAQFILSRRENG